MMKIIAAFCIIISVVSAEYIVKTREDLLTTRDKCVKELNIDSEHVEQFKKWQYPNDAVTQCYLRCVFENFGLFTEKDGFDIEKIHHQLLGSQPGSDHATDSLHGQIESCVKNVDPNVGVCESAYQGVICFFKNNLQIVQQSVAQPATPTTPQA